MEKKYTLVFDCDRLKDVEISGSLDEVKLKADELLVCTRKDIKLKQGNKVVATRKFVGVEYTSDCPKQQMPICYTNVGYYSDWE